jgi:hypothetical protein
MHMPLVNAAASAWYGSLYGNGGGESGRCCRSVKERIAGCFLVGENVRILPDAAQVPFSLPDNSAGPTNREAARKMKTQIVNVSVLQSAKVAAVFYLVISIPMCLLMLIPAMMGKDSGTGFSVVMLIVLPVLYTLGGFIFTLVSAWIYNMVASRVGGFEFTTVEVAGE